MKATIGSSVSIPLALLDPGVVDSIKKTLTLKKNQSKVFAFGKTVDDEWVFFFRIEGDRILLPRSYGISLCKDLGIELDDQRSTGDKIDISFNETEQQKKPELKEKQDTIVRDVVAGLLSNQSNSGLLQAGTGCHAAGELILMADGTRKKAEDIVVGDLLMGIDGPRCVLELHRGRQRMARVIPNKGEPFVVNVGHILTVLWSGCHGVRRDGDVIDISVAEWLLSPKHFRAHTKLYRPRVDEFKTSYTSYHRPIDPYHLGLLLGDGALKRSVGITTSEIERIGLLNSKPESKFIPHQYLTSSRIDRLNLLAGLLDTDGSLSRDGCEFDYVSKSKQLASDVVFLCRSLGLAAYATPCVKKDQNGKSGKYYRVFISGDCTVIPTRVRSKRATRRLMKKDVQRTGFRVELLDEDDYFGFVVDKDHRYLMGDFTLTHNTGKTVMGAKVACGMKRRTLVVVNSEFLMDQWKKTFLRFTDIKEDEIGYIQQDTQDTSGKKVVIGMIQTMIRRDFTPQERKAFGTVIYDECHHLPADKFSEAMLKFDAKYVLGLTATPKRFDGLHSLLTLGLGSTLNSLTLNAQLIPDVYIVKIPTSIPDAKYMTWVSFNGKQQKAANLAKLTNEITKIAKRNQKIVDLTVKAAAKGRKVMVFSSRINHLKELQKSFDALAGAGKSAMFIGGLTDTEREQAKLAQVMFCTYQYAAEALDVPNRDCAIMATPISFVSQMVGRILRSDDNKKSPIVVDILDSGVKKLELMASTRVKEYKRLRAKIHLPNGQTLN